MTTAGTYNRTVPSANGCDSVIILNLGILPTPNAVVSASGSLSICQGGQVTLQVSSGVGLQYAWQLNGQNIPGATSAAYTASQSGTYTILVTNSQGCSALSLPNVVIVSNNPGATINAAGPTTICQGGSVVLNANTGVGLNYQWFRNGIIIAGATGSSYTASQSGSYSVQVGIGQGCQALSNTIQVIENITPTVAIISAGPTNICAGGNGVVLLVSNQGLGQVYQWRRGGVAIIGATGTTYPANQTGTYDCIASSNGCGSTSNGISVTVNANPTVSVSAGGPATFCQGGSVTLSASPVTGGTYQWISGGVDIPGATQLSYLATTTGNFAVRVTNAIGCVGNSGSTLVTVNPLPTAQINASGSTTFCAGGSVLLRADS
ncbi:MAG: xylanase, partial [Sphingomonadales bacterium]|nr:xylanase [Sphingomonadales bacterium]